jgi:anti-sigma B factor antagonist
VVLVINLYINERRIGNVTVLDLKGRVRIGGTTVALHRTIRTLIQEGKLLILLNLAEVSHVDSCGLGELIASHVSLRNKGGEIRLLRLTESLRELMSVTKLLEVFDVYESESEAVVSFGSDVAERKPRLAVV